MQVPDWKYYQDWFEWCFQHPVLCWCRRHPLLTIVVAQFTAFWPKLFLSERIRHRDEQGRPFVNDPGPGVILTLWLTGESIVLIWAWDRRWLWFEGAGLGHAFLILFISWIVAVYAVMEWVPRWREDRQAIREGRLLRANYYFAGWKPNPRCPSGREAIWRRRKKGQGHL